MSFTEDELQSFNTILERRLSAHRQELERTFEQRITILSRDLEQRLVMMQQDLVRIVTHKLNDQQNEFNLAMSQKLGTQQSRLIQALGHEVEQRQQHQQQQFEGLVDRLLAAQLMGIEQLLNQRQQSLTSNADAEAAEALVNEPEVSEPREAAVTRALQSEERSSPPEPFEVQTDLSWEDLMEVIGRALDERLGLLRDSLQEAMRGWEQRLSVQVHLSRMGNQVESYQENLQSMPQVFQSIERLEQIIESMQVATTANSALLSNRLYHHQQLPLERAHPSSDPTHQHTFSQPTTESPNGIPGTRVTLNSETQSQEP